MSVSAWRRLWDSYIKDLNVKYGNIKNVIRNGKPMEEHPQKTRKGGYRYPEYHSVLAAPHIYNPYVQIGS